MVEWFSRWVWWIASRCMVTLVCIFVLQDLLHQEGYFIPFKTLVVGATALIVGVYVWMRGPRQPKPKLEMVWSEDDKD